MNKNDGHGECSQKLYKKIFSPKKLKYPIREGSTNVVSVSKMTEILKMFQTKLKI